MSSRLSIALLAVAVSLNAAGAVAQVADAPPAETDILPAESEAPAIEPPADLEQPADLAAEPPSDDTAAPPAPEPGQEVALSPDPGAADDLADEESAVDESAEPSADAAATDWAGLIERAPAFLAVTHHAAVHLPIALWLFGAFFVVVGMIFPSWRTQIPLACLVGGAVTSVAAVLSGWWYADYEWGNDWREVEWSEHVVKHRWAAVAVLGVSVILSIMALANQRSRNRGVGFVWRAGLIGLALAVAWVGHVGGEMIQGEGFLEEAFEAWVNPDGE